MKHEFAEEQQLRATVALLGLDDVTIRAVLPGFFEYRWRCGCVIVNDASRREWATCEKHESADLRGMRRRFA
jgi:hypothetical protein